MPHDAFYWSKDWRKFRARILRERPTCEVPGCDVASKHVDHIVSRRAGGAPFDPKNVQALCPSHHSTKTSLRDGGFGNKASKTKLVVRGCSADGTPLSPEHPWHRKA